MDSRLQQQNNGRSWRWCRRHLSPEQGCPRCRPRVSVNAGLYPLAGASLRDGAFRTFRKETS